MSAPIIKEPIPTIVINELAAYGPIELTDYLTTPEDETEELIFQAGLEDGSPLPKGIICTESGLLTGIPAKNTTGVYQVVVEAKNASGTVKAAFSLEVKPGFVMEDRRDWTDLKAQIWEAIQLDLPTPALTDMYERAITPMDVYYLLERWGVIIIWDAFNLDPPGQKKLLSLEGTSKHYNIFDRGSSLVGAPKELLSHERTAADGIATAKAMAREVYQRGWSIELAGFDKYVRAAWVEIERLGDKHGKKLKVINFEPNKQDVKVYQKLNKELR